MIKRTKKIEDEFVRDMTAIVPRPKSEVRRRLNDILEQARQQEREKWVDKIENLKDIIDEKNEELETKD